jgi:hypothetical protein
VSENDRKLEFPSLQGRHVYLRAIIPDDYRFLQMFETSGDFAVRWRFRGGTPSPENWARALWADVLVQYLIVGRKSNTPVGLVAAYQPNFQDGHAKIAAARFDPAGPSPAMILGLAIFLRYVFSCWDLRKLYMELPEYNYAQFSSGAGRIFELEGRLRDHYWFGGETWDQLLLAIHRETWQKREGALLRAEAPSMRNV